MKGHQMLAKLRKDHENEEGFTLIELLVVVIIIGILAAIAIPAFLNQRQRGYQAALTSDVRNAAIEVESQYTSTTTWPADDADLTVDAGTDAIVVRGSTTDTVIQYDGDGTVDGFCLFGTRPDLPGYILYDSVSGGIQTFQEFAATPETACTITAGGATVS